MYRHIFPLSRLKSVFLLLLCVFLGVIAQLFLKKAVSCQENILFLISSPFFITGVSLYGISMLLWIVVLSKFELSYAYPILSLGYVFVALGSRLFLGETISPMQWLGIFTIMVGVMMVGWR